MKISLKPIDILIGILFLSTLIMASTTLILNLIGLDSPILPITSVPSWIGIGLIHWKYKRK